MHQHPYYVITQEYINTHIILLQYKFITLILIYIVTIQHHNILEPTMEVTFFNNGFKRDPQSYFLL